MEDKKSKICSKCKKEKPLTPKYFYERKTMKSGFRNICIECINEYSKNHYRNRREYYEKYRLEHKEEARKYKKEYQKKNRGTIIKRQRLKNLFSISLEKYKEMLKKQNFVCAICGCKEIVKRNGRIIDLSVDHNHKTGKVRGLLCNNCNTLLGRSFDNPFILIKSIKYLRKNDNNR